MKKDKSDAEPAHLLRPSEQPLDVFFSPSSIALIGATANPGSVGRTILACSPNSISRSPAMPSVASGF